MAKILVVEDHEMNRELITRKLRREGYEVLTAVDGAEGVDAAEQHLPDLIVMDIALPILNGYEAARVLRQSKKTRHIPILGLSAHAMTGDADKALAAGCNDYDTKPIDWKRLLGKISTLLASAPAAAPDTGESSGGKPVHAARARVFSGHLLVVCPDSGLSDELCRQLGDLGCTSERVSDPERAHELLTLKPFAAVLLDLSFPESSCKGLLKQIRSDRRRNRPRLIALASGDGDELVGWLQRGADDYILQPLRKELLAVRLNAVLDPGGARAAAKNHRRTTYAEQRHAEHLLRVLLPEPLVEELKATHKILPRRSPEVAVLFCDVVGFEQLCDSGDPLAVLSQLQELIVAFEKIAERNQVKKVKTLGDAFMAAAGLFESATSPVLDCVRCALEIRDTAARLREAWDLRIGIDVGPVLAGVVGHRRYQFDLWGSTVHNAAQVKARGEINAINLGAAAWEKVKLLCRGTEVAARPAGDDEPPTIYRVDDLIDASEAPTVVVR
ncbi:MAG: response regulator [bacterium]|nr:response regulator [bacterium]